MECNLVWIIYSSYLRDSSSRGAVYINIQRGEINMTGIVQPYVRYLPVRLSGRGVGQPGRGVSRAGRRRRGQCGGGDGWRDEASSRRVSAQRGGGHRGTVQSHADTALDLLGSQLRVLLLLLDQSGTGQGGTKRWVGQKKWKCSC